MPTPSRPCVLCVDDDEGACEILSLLLSSVGIDATCARSAVAARKLIKGRRWDLFILDGWLPGTDGFAFCREIRKFDSHTPILFYSGAAYDTDKQNGYAAGANDYVTKPDVDGLIEKILALIAEANSSAPEVEVRSLPNHVRKENLFGISCAGR
jgi:two-component system, OmpR family, response regulator VicR